MEFGHENVLYGEAFEAVCGRPPLAGKRIFNHGSFSVLFESDTDDAVYRLSSDNATHDFAAKAKELGLEGVVKLVADYGAVALYTDATPYPDYLWLAELERLENLEDNPEQYAAVKGLLRYLTDCEEGGLLCTAEEKDALLTKLLDLPRVPCTEKAVAAIQRMLPNYVLTNVDVDLSISNFMVRAGTGEVVLSDPVHGLCNISEQRRLRLLAEKVVLEVDA